MLRILNKKNSTLKIIALCYILLIFVGALILTLPVSSKSGISINYLDALFTATSATCVTGLVVFDTFSQFTLLGQLTILVLIQIGGIGFMTVASIFLMLTGKRIGLWSRGALTESINAFQVGGIIRLIRRVIRATIIFELLGTVLLAIRFCPQFGLGTGLYYSVFHSVSAFCNAGFDLFGRFSEYGSLIPYQTDILVNLTIAFLIIIGGLGFVVWDDMLEHKLKFSKYKLHSKIVLISTIILIATGTLMFYFLESGFAFINQSGFNKWIMSFFQSVTPRTAGFSTIDISALSDGGVFLTMLLMLIGASPGSTAGGIKTTTFVIIIISVISYLKNDNDVNIFKRRLEKDTLKKAISTFAVYLLFAVSGIFIILMSQNLSFSKVAFEVLSAIGTVGLSTGVTRELNSLSQIVIMVLMFCGRIGSLTFASIFAKKNIQKTNTRFPEGKVIIG